MSWVVVPHSLNYDSIVNKAVLVLVMPQQFIFYYQPRPCWRVSKFEDRSPNKSGLIMSPPLTLFQPSGSYNSGKSPSNASTHPHPLVELCSASENFYDGNVLPPTSPLLWFILPFRIPIGSKSTIQAKVGRCHVWNIRQHIDRLRERGRRRPVSQSTRDERRKECAVQSTFSHRCRCTSLRVVNFCLQTTNDVT